MVSQSVSDLPSWWPHDHGPTKVGAMVKIAQQSKRKWCYNKPPRFKATFYRSERNFTQIISVYPWQIPWLGSAVHCCIMHIILKCYKLYSIIRIHSFDELKLGGDKLKTFSSLGRTPKHILRFVSTATRQSRGIAVLLHRRQIADCLTWYWPRGRT